MLKWMRCFARMRSNCLSDEFKVFSSRSRSLTDLTTQYKTPVMSNVLTDSSLFVEASVCDIVDLSKSVRGVRLKVYTPEFIFKAGQWVDLLAPGIKEVAGYSICSTPRLAQERGIIELAVQRGDFPPTLWIHSQCKVGDVVQIQIGGKFYFDPVDDGLPPRDLMLVAGGVGINPLLSVMRHMRDVSSEYRPRTVLLAFSAASLEDLIFREEILRLMSESDGSTSICFYVTRQRRPSDTQSVTSDTHLVQSSVESSSVQYKYNQRIDESELSRLLQVHWGSRERLENLDCYICGPSGLIDDTNTALLRLGVGSEQIKYEKWW